MANSERSIKVLMAKPGLDGHDTGVVTVAMALRDAGMEVIYFGIHQTPERIVAAAIQEDVDVIGLSILSGGHMGVCSRVMKLLKENDATHIMVLVGGIYDVEDHPKLKEMGVTEVFGIDCSLDSIVDFIKTNVRRKVGPS